MSPRKIIFTVCALALEVTAGSTHDQNIGTSAEDTRLTLRNETAKRYLNPESHVKSARFNYNWGRKAQAFYILEWARSQFEDEAFTPVF